MGAYSEIAAHGDYGLVSKDDYKIKELKSERKWGKRDNVTNIGKTPEDMQFHKVPKRMFSVNTQVDKLFGWMTDVKDRRTRRIGKHYIKNIQVERQTILEEYESWKAATTFDEDKGRKWSLDFGKLTEKQVLVEHEKEEQRWKDIPDKEIYGLFDDTPYDDDDFWSFLTSSPNAVDAMREYEEKFKKMPKGKQDELLNSGNYRLEVIKEIKQKEIPIFGSYFLRFALAKKIMTNLTKGRERQFILTNPVYVKKDDERRLETRVTELHVLFAEFDHYKIDKYKHLTAQEMEKVIFEKLDSIGFPRPTETTYSRGPQLWWKHNPIPEYRIEQWKLTQGYLNGLLADLGADDNALDAVRVLRAVGSVHEVTGQTIWGVSYTDDRYDFDSIFNKFCLTLWNDHKLEKHRKRHAMSESKQKKIASKREWMFQQGLIDHEGNFTDKYDKSKKKTRNISKDAQLNPYNYVHSRRLSDIFSLVRMRNGEMEGYRRYLLFFTYYLELCITGGNRLQAWETMKELYDCFSWNEHEFKVYQGKNESANEFYSKWLLNEKNGYSPKTTTLIDKLNITRDEMLKLDCLFDKEEKKRRKTLYHKKYYQTIDKDVKKAKYEAKRDSEGKMSRAEQNALKMDQIRVVLATNPTATNPLIAEATGIPMNTVKRYAAKLRKEIGSN